MTTTTLPLSAADRELHAQIGVTLDVLLRKQIHRVEDREGRELLCINGRPGRMDGIIYPYLDHVGSPRRGSASPT